MSKNKDDNNFLVYMYMREDGTPYYVGKGRPRRPYDKGGRACPTPPKNRIVIYRENLDEETAFELEKELIANYGRKDIGTGILRNLSDGGEGPSGYKHTEERKKKMSESLSGEKHPGYTPKNWYHPVHGTLLNKSVSDLIKLFPEQKLLQGNLSQVVNGKRRKYKGWTLLENKDLEYDPPGQILRDWYHPQHGEITGVSATNLSKMFPEQNLLRDSLMAVGKGRLNRHKGWRLLKNKDVEFKPPKKEGVVRRNWYHPEHGEILNKSVTELIRLFPGENLLSSSLSMISNGRRHYHKGWCLLENKKIVYEKPEDKLKDWFHPVHGTILKTTVQDLSALYPEQKLHKTYLYKVAKGDIPRYKGWELFEKSVES